MKTGVKTLIYLCSIVMLITFTLLKIFMKYIVNIFTNKVRMYQLSSQVAMLIRKHFLVLSFTFSQERCCVSVAGFSAKNKRKIVYPNLNSAMRPILHDDH
jgi:Na+-driven multidrug efflux pump